MNRKSMVAIGIASFVGFAAGYVLEPQAAAVRQNLLTHMAGALGCIGDEATAVHDTFARILSTTEPFP